MISIILYILILQKLEMLNGLPLALVIIDIIFWVLSLICGVISKALEIRNR